MNDFNSEEVKKVTPLRCLQGALISGVIAGVLYWLTKAIASTYANLPITSTNPIVINISVAVRTLVIGLATLGTFVFGFVALGLVALGIQLIIQSFGKTDANRE